MPMRAHVASAKQAKASPEAPGALAASANRPHARSAKQAQASQGLARGTGGACGLGQSPSPRTHEQPRARARDVRRALSAPSAPSAPVRPRPNAQSPIALALASPARTHARTHARARARAVSCA